MMSLLMAQLENTGARAAAASRAMPVSVSPSNYQPVTVMKATAPASARQIRSSRTKWLTVDNTPARRTTDAPTAATRFLNGLTARTPSRRST
jgi:hypothetical protein